MQSYPPAEIEVTERKGDSIPRPLNPNDWPIAWRNGVRTCTQHPIANFTSYHRLSPTYMSFALNLLSVDIPKNIHEALKVPEWQSAVLEEMKALEKTRTWEIIQPPKGKTPVGCKWVFTLKYKADGSIDRTKHGWWRKGTLRPTESTTKRHLLRLPR